MEQQHLGNKREAVCLASRVLDKGHPGKGAACPCVLSSSGQKDILHFVNSLSPLKDPKGAKASRAAERGAIALPPGTWLNPSLAVLTSEQLSWDKILILLCL